MKPGDPIGKQKIKLLHVLFAKFDPDAVEAIRDGIAEVTGDTSTLSLNEAQAWEVINGLCRELRQNNPAPICVVWCEGYTMGRLPRGGIDWETRIPSQAQIWGIHKLMRGAGVLDGQAFLAARFPKIVPDGVIRTAREAWQVSKSLRAMGANRTEPRQGGAAAMGA